MPGKTEISPIVSIDLMVGVLTAALRRSRGAILGAVFVALVAAAGASARRARSEQQHDKLSAFQICERMKRARYPSRCRKKRWARETRMRTKASSLRRGYHRENATAPETQAQRLSSADRLRVPQNKALVGGVDPNDYPPRGLRRDFAQMSGAWTPERCAQTGGVQQERCFNDILTLKS